MTFSQRLRRRERVWWNKPNRWRHLDSYTHLLHRLKESHFLRDRNDPAQRWQCCVLWQRVLSNKWNAREFALRHGCRVPELYWYGRRIRRLPFDALPDHYVVRRVWGTAGRGVYVIAKGRDLLRETTYDRASLLRALGTTAGRISRFPTLVEEFVKTESGDYALPVEYKCHTFGDTIAAIQVVHRVSSRRKASQRYYKPSWEMFDDPMNTSNVFGDYSDPPRCLEEILACARRLGGAYGHYIRSDFYATDKGAVFGEFASIPNNATGFTPFADEYFGEFWQRIFPERT